MKDLFNRNRHNQVCFCVCCLLILEAIVHSTSSCSFSFSFSSSVSRYFRVLDWMAGALCKLAAQYYCYCLLIVCDF